MATNSPAIKQALATRLLKAAKAAGFDSARLTSYPDGRIEIVGENGPAPTAPAPLSAFEQWKAENANRT